MGDLDRLAILYSGNSPEHEQIYKNGEIIKAGDLMKQHLEDSLQYALSCL